MMSQAYLGQPPRLAVWFINLFTAHESAESIFGDLLEEYSYLASKSGVTFARRWYRRQTVKTIAHLFGSGYRAAPWSTTAAAVGGFCCTGLSPGSLTNYCRQSPTDTSHSGRPTSMLTSGC